MFSNIPKERAARRVPPITHNIPLIAILRRRLADANQALLADRGVVMATRPVSLVDPYFVCYLVSETVSGEALLLDPLGVRLEQVMT